MADLIGDAELRYITQDGKPMICGVSEQTITTLGRPRPVRLPASHAGQRHYPGLCWTRTTRDHVVYESRLEMDRILIADFDRDVSWISAQPFWVAGRDGDSVRRHAPDFLLCRHDGSATIVDVKTPHMAENEKVRAVFAWTRRIADRLGADYEIWTGADATFLANIRFLALSRRESRSSILENSDALNFEEPLTFNRAESLLAAARIERPRHLLFEMIWLGTLTANLRRPLQPTSLLQPVRAK